MLFCKKSSNFCWSFIYHTLKRGLKSKFFTLSINKIIRIKFDSFSISFHFFVCSDYSSNFIPAHKDKNATTLIKRIVLHLPRCFSDYFSLWCKKEYEVWSCIKELKYVEQKYRCSITIPFSSLVWLVLLKMFNCWLVNLRRHFKVLIWFLMINAAWNLNSLQTF